MYNKEQWLNDARIVAEVLENAPKIDKFLRVGLEEFQARQQNVIAALIENGIDAAFVYSDEHYSGDVPYLGGCTNISIEPIAGVIGKNGFHILAGLEGGYVAEQMAKRSGAGIHKVEMLKLADEEYPIDAEEVEDVIEMAVGGKPNKIGLLTPRAVFPLAIFERLCEYMGGSENIVDAQEIYYKVKYEKSPLEIELTRQAASVADTMVEGMLRVIKPGMTETQVAQWGYAIALELGAEQMGFEVIVNTDESNRTLIGKALNKVIKRGDVVSVGASPKCDGLTACTRVSVICAPKSEWTEDQKYWFDFVNEAYQVGLDAFIDVAENEKPAWLQEQALVDYFTSREAEVCAKIGKKIDFARQKPYTGTHNAGYTECQEFYGAITLNSKEPMGQNIIMMLDVAVRGVGNMWDDIIIPGLDYLVVERTLAKTGNKVEALTRLPIDVSYLVTV